MLAVHGERHTTSSAKPRSVSRLVCHTGGCVDIVRALLAGGADPRLCQADGGSPVMAAADFGHAEAVAELLAAGSPSDDALSFAGQEVW